MKERTRGEASRRNHSLFFQQGAPARCYERVPWLPLVNCGAIVFSFDQRRSFDMCEGYYEAMTRIIDDSPDSGRFCGLVVG